VNPDTHEHLRYKLERERDNLIERIGITREEFHTLLEDQDPGDSADVVSGAMDSERLAVLEVHEREALRRQEHELRKRLRARGFAFRASDRLARDELHNRNALR